MENLDFWNRVKTLIKQNKITQETLANEAGISFNNLKQQIFYNRIPTADEAAKIAKTLNVSTEYLLYGEDNISDLETVLIVKFRKLSEEQKKIILALISGLADK